MWSKKQQPPPQFPPPRLLVPRFEARTRLLERIDRGKAISEAPIRVQSELDREKANFRKWDDFNAELLRRVFDNHLIANEYRASVGFGFVSLDSDLTYWIGDFRDDVLRQVTRLESIVERLELIPEISGIAALTPTSDPSGPAETARRIFVFMDMTTEGSKGLHASWKGLALSLSFFMSSPTKDER